METLFPLSPILPCGFSYVPRFISVEEENTLMSCIKRLNLRNMEFQGYKAKRKVISFGYDWSFEKRILTTGKTIPADFRWLIAKVARHENIEEDDISELLVTEYPVSSVINWHRDAPPFDSIFGISLLSDCVFRMRPYNKLLQSRKNILAVPVERRSLYIMKSESRTEWEHSIVPVQELRYSITLRTLKANAQIKTLENG